MELRIVLLLGLLGASAVTDLLERKIFNALTYPAVVAGLLLQAAAGGADLGGALAASLLSVAIFYPLCRAGGMGLGDLKLMAAVGALGGFELWGTAMINSALAGGIFALLVTLARGTAVATLRRAVQVPGMLVRSLKTRRPARFPAPHAAEVIPYGVAIAVGTTTAVFWRWPWG